MGDLWGVRSEALPEEIGQCVLVIGGGRVNWKTGGFVDRQKRIVLIKDIEVERDIGLLEGRAHQHDVLAGPYAFARAAARAVGSISAGSHDFLGSGSRKPWNPMLNESIQALTHMFGRDGERQDDRSRIATRWKRGLWTSRRPSMTARIDCRLGCCHFLVLMFEWLTL
jgi:hypothetical protein